MLLPSSIHRAEDLVGIAIPMDGLLCASAPPPDAAATKPASASEKNLVSLGMLHSFGCYDFDRCGRQIADRCSWSRLQCWISFVGHLLCASDLDVGPLP